MLSISLVALLVVSLLIKLVCDDLKDEQFDGIDTDKVCGVLHTGVVLDDGAHNVDVKLEVEEDVEAYVVLKLRLLVSARGCCSDVDREDVRGGVIEGVADEVLVPAPVGVDC